MLKQAFFWRLLDLHVNLMTSILVPVLEQMVLLVSELELLKGLLRGDWQGFPVVRGKQHF